jgi:hypothetical protein
VNNYCDDKAEEFSPLTSVSNHSAEKRQIIKKQKIFKTKLKILKNKQNLLKNILSGPIEPSVGQCEKLDEQSDEIQML